MGMIGDRARLRRWTLKKLFVTHLAAKTQDKTRGTLY
jgi:hypothetical protein